MTRKLSPPNVPLLAGSRKAVIFIGGPVFVLFILIASLAWAKEGYQDISFEQLSFGYKPPVDVEHPDGTVTKGSKKPTPIPPAVKALNGKKVAIKGFFIPVETDGTNVRTFLFADQLVTCLFCQGLGYDQWIFSTVTGRRGFHLSDDEYEEALTVYGTMEVGEQYEDKQLTGIYRLKADSFESSRKKVFGLF